MTSSNQTRADRFVREIAELKIPDPAAGRPRLWLRLGVAMMVAGLVLGVTAYLVSHRTSSSLVQGDAITIGLGGVTVSVVGAALFVRYSLTAFLRFWMARQSYDLTLLGDRLLDSGATRDLAGTDHATTDHATTDHETTDHETADHETADHGRRPVSG